MAGEVSWIKVVTDIFEDQKIKLIKNMPEGKSIVLMWIQLLCEAGKLNNSGWVMLDEDIPYTSAELATIFGETQQMVEFAMKTFTRYKMVEVDEYGRIYIMNWEKHQNVETLDKIRIQTKERVRKHREKKKMESLPVGNVTNDHVVTLRNEGERERELELDLERDKTCLSKDDFLQEMNKRNIKQRGTFKFDKAASYQKMMDDDLILEAIKIAENRGIDYILSILEEWNGFGYKSLSDIQKRKEAAQSARQLERNAKHAYGTSLAGNAPTESGIDLVGPNGGRLRLKRDD